MSNPNNKPLGNLIDAARAKERASRRPVVLINDKDRDSFLGGWVYWHRFGMGENCTIVHHRDSDLIESLAGKEVFAPINSSFFMDKSDVIAHKAIDCAVMVAKSVYIVSDCDDLTSCINTFDAELLQKQKNIIFFNGFCKSVLETAWSHCYGSTAPPDNIVKLSNHNNWIHADKALTDANKSIDKRYMCIEKLVFLKHTR